MSDKPSTNWSEQELKQRILVLESAVQERNSVIEDLRRKLRVAESKARIVDEVQSENKVLRAKLVASSPTTASAAVPTINNNNNNNNNNDNDNTNFIAKQQKDAIEKSHQKHDEIQALRSKLLETTAPSPLTIGGADNFNEGANLPKTEEEEIDAVMERAQDEAHVEDREDELLRERLQNLISKK